MGLAALSALLLGGVVTPAAQAAPCPKLVEIGFGNQSCSLGDITYNFSNGTELAVVGSPRPIITYQDYGITASTDASGTTRYFLRQNVTFTNLAFGTPEFTTPGFAEWLTTASRAANSPWTPSPTGSVATWSWTSWVPSSVAGSSVYTTIPSGYGARSFDYAFSAQGAQVRLPRVLSPLPSSMSTFEYTLVTIPDPFAGIVTGSSEPAWVPAVVGSGSGYNSLPSRMGSFAVEAIDATGWGRQFQLPAWFPGTPASGPGYNTLPGMLRTSYDPTSGSWVDTLGTSGVNMPGDVYVGTGMPRSTLSSPDFLYRWFPTWIPRDPNAPFERLTYDELIDRGETTGFDWIAEQVLNSVSIDYVWQTGTRPPGYVDPSVDVPEPSTFGLALMALGGIALARHRRRALAETRGCPHASSHLC